MKKALLFFTVLITAFPVVAQKKAQNSKLSRPKLVVGIMVDQMRWDYLYRYYDRYEQNGFKRLLNEGFSCENTYIDYIPTVTAIGHSSVYTGSVPAIHGIAGNDFIIQATGKKVYCTEDSTVQTVGSTSDAGEMSPRNLLTTTITDELNLATNFRSKIIGVALKDRGAILPAGHTADAAYWFDDLTGNWISSTYYMKELPEWVNKFNNQKLAEKYLKQNWNTLHDIGTYVQSSPDNNSYEGKFSGMAAPTLPVKTSEMYSKNYGIIRSTPYGNSITMEMAKAALENEQMGRDEITDFLAVSFSSTDYIGHRFGVNAIEVEDTYLRLDRDLAELFTFLDKKVGKGNYTVFLSADHAAAHNPNFLLDHNIPAGVWPGGKLLEDLNRELEKKYHAGNIVLSFSNSQVHLNNPLITRSKLNKADIQKDCIQFLKDKPGVAYVLAMEDVQEAAIPDILQSRIINGYNHERSGEIQIVLKPAWLSGSATGTGHSTWYPYDAHIPLVWMGWGIQQGQTNEPTHMTDIAATLAALLHIQAPNGSIGKPIPAVLK
ncbi:alkaline phosphatase family protein [Pontibacter sp. 172403-2]|uniref:alkaline phosphatase PafA n=1 Tax=Pontibacter rufus TaxID=2791028 RepID=UPI0018AFD7A8|nr:alkaline phosphatase PafA [Pontibacter sp. 172403-2]MBF9254480.1 alkaline phosphatase family protein [Pontibacter sp. 172403-2]